jgi:hypothetical protein
MKVEIKTIADSTYTVELHIDNRLKGWFTDCEFGRWVSDGCSEDTPEDFTDGCFTIGQAENKAEAIAYAIGCCVDGIGSLFADGKEIHV